MNFTRATEFYRKSGVAQRRHLQFALPEKQNPEAIRPRTLACPESETADPSAALTLRSHGTPGQAG